MGAEKPELRNQLRWIIDHSERTSSRVYTTEAVKDSYAVYSKLQRLKATVGRKVVDDECEEDLSFDEELSERVTKEKEILAAKEEELGVKKNLSRRRNAMASMEKQEQLFWHGFMWANQFTDKDGNLCDLNKNLFGHLRQENKCVAELFRRQVLRKSKLHPDVSTERIKINRQERRFCCQPLSPIEELAYRSLRESWRCSSLFTQSQKGTRCSTRAPTVLFNWEEEETGNKVAPEDVNVFDYRASYDLERVSVTCLPNIE